jgi:S1-C subfamily serine protease
MANHEATILETLSTDLGSAVEKAAAAVLMVQGRRRFVSGGVQWRKGVVVTANHTLRRDEGITLSLPDGRAVPATMRGRDPTTDLAILTIQDGETALPEIAETLWSKQSGRASLPSCHSKPQRPRSAGRLKRRQRD